MCLVRDSLLLIYCEDVYLLDSAAHHTLFLMHKVCISDKSMTYKYATIVMGHYFRALFFTTLQLLLRSFLSKGQVRLNHH